MAPVMSRRLSVIIKKVLEANRLNSDVVAVPKSLTNPKLYPPDEDYEQICTIYLERVQPIWPILKVADIHATRKPKCVKDVIFRQVCDALRSAAVPKAHCLGCQCMTSGPSPSQQHMSFFFYVS